MSFTDCASWYCMHVVIVTFMFIALIEGLTHPGNWDDPDPIDPYRRKPLTPGSTEYHEVLKNVQMSAGGPSEKQIVKVCGRI